MLGNIVKFLLLALINALVLGNLQTMIDKPDWQFVVASLLALVAIDVVYLSRRRMIAAKYLLPGTIFLLIFALYPVLYTFFVSFTNYGTGNLIAKAQAIELIEKNSISATAEAIRYDLEVLAADTADGPLAFLLTDAAGNNFLGTADGLTPVPESDLVAQGPRVTLAGYVALNLGQSNARKDEISFFRVPSEQGEIQNDGFRSAFAKQQVLHYDEETNTFVNILTQKTYTEQEGHYVGSDGERLDPGWRAFVGLKNYERINTSSIRGPFARVFIWTFVFAVASVLITFALGLLLAMVFANERMKGRRTYRLVMIVPYALPSFMTALVWRGMFNQRFGIINRIFATNFAWLDGQWLPYASILIVNLWLGFPYMFLICTGALQSIPSDLREAAFVDGATGFKAFRKVTMPLLLIAVAPMLIASFAFNFNNFNIIYLLTEGKPPIAGSTAGRTDILISYMYKLAFAGGRGQDLGFAAAISVIIFIVVAAISAYSFRFTKSFEEIK